MPFYEYECANCKFYMEVMQKISDTPLTKCPSCGQKQLKKLVSAPVFRLKGGGWYETDFKSDGEAKRNLAAGDKAEKTEGAADAKAAAPESKSGEAKTAEASTSAAPASGEKPEGKPARSARKSAPPPRKPAAKRSPSKSKAKPRSARKSRR
jgi:putative FmdB family regulatory protein